MPLESSALYTASLLQRFLRREKNAGRRTLDRRRAFPPSPSATWRSAEPQAHRPTVGLSAALPSERFRGWALDLGKPVTSGSRPAGPGIQPRTRAGQSAQVTRGASFHSRDAQQVPGTFPQRQVPATGPRWGRVGPSPAAAGESPPVGARVSPDGPCHIPRGVAGPLTTSHSGLAGLGKGDVIVAGRCRKVPPIGDRQSGLLSVALGQY